VSTYDPLGIDYMCPFCVTPWKCNGPHIEPHDEPEFQTYIDNHWDEAIGQAIDAIYEDCHHTKYEGCRPCPHDVIADRVRALETTPESRAIRALTREAQAMGLPEATDGPPPQTR
jgi:hypothetical protein